MKVLQVNCVFNKGSTGKITYDIHSELLKQGYDSVICYGRGEKTKEKNVYKTCGEFYSKCNNLLSRLTGLMYGGCCFSTKKLISIIKKEKPDVVHLQCLNGYFVNVYRLITWLKKNNVKTVLTLHAEFMYTANCGYALDCDRWQSGCGHCPRMKRETKSFCLDGTHKSWLKMKKAFDGFDDNLVVVSVSPWLMDRAKKSPILQNKKHEVILNGVNTEIFHCYDTSELRKQMGLDGKKIIFHATPAFNNDVNSIKGGYYVIKLAEKMLDENVVFVVAGNYPNGLKVPSNVLLLGNVSDQILLAKYYSMADVTLLTSKKETFSMVTAESLCCGTPVVGFKAGAPEQIAIPEYSSFVEYGDVDALKSEVDKIIGTVYLSEQMSIEASGKYSKKTMMQKYVHIYEGLNGKG